MGNRVNGLLASLALCAVVTVPSSACSIGDVGNGTKLAVGKLEIYYKGGVTQDEAKKAGDMLHDQFGFGAKATATVQIVKKKDLYQLRMVIKTDKREDPEVHSTLKLIAGMVSGEAFGGAKIEVHITNRFLKTKKVLKVDSAPSTKPATLTPAPTEPTGLGIGTGE